MTQTSQLVSWKPRSYQKAGVKLCIAQACAGLLYKPGRGKTSVIYMAFRILKDKQYVDKMLVICPLRPMYIVWPEQKDKYAEFSHLRVGIMHGKDKEAVLNSDDYDIYVINPEGLDWLFGAQRQGNKVVVDKARTKYVHEKFGMLVVDESHKFKDSSTNRFKLLKQVLGKFRRRYILTGTVMPKGLMDLFGQIYILDEGASLGRYITHYRTTYFYPSGYGGYDWTPQPGARERILDRIAPLTHVVTTTEGLDLPELIFNDIYVDLPPAAKKLYDQMESAMVALLEEDSVVAANAAVASSKCRQIANGGLYSTEEAGVYRLVHDAKVEALAELIEQLQGNPLLITYEFGFDSDRLQEKLKIPSISSGNIKRDTELIRQFARGELVAVQGHPQSISLGTDGLQQNCSDIAMFGVTWRASDYEQVIDRVRRTGAKGATVTVHRILARDTLDERVVQVTEGRIANQDDFMRVLQSMRRKS
jgi:SNF2 family DNA or RNA helicase